jgi:hypothetical protein
VTDRVPRQLTDDPLQALRVLGREVQAQMSSALAARDQAEADRDHTIDELRATLGRVRALEGPLPICRSSKKIQDDKGKWEPFDRYVRTHSEAKIFHKICPDCASAISV